MVVVYTVDRQSDRRIETFEEGSDITAASEERDNVLQNRLLRHPHLVVQRIEKDGSS